MRQAWRPPGSRHTLDDFGRVIDTLGEQFAYVKYVCMGGIDW
jgi:hypothetical protein